MTNIEVGQHEEVSKIPVHKRVARGVGRIANKFTVSEEERQAMGIVRGSEAELAATVARSGDNHIPREVDLGTPRDPMLVSLSADQRQHANFIRNSLPK